MPDGNADLELADAVRAIRRELKMALDEGRDEEIRLRLGPVELELRLEIGRSAGVDGGVRVWVASMGGSTTDTVTQMHMIRLTLYPQSRDGGDVDIHDTVPGDKPVE